MKTFSRWVVGGLVMAGSVLVTQAREQIDDGRVVVSFVNPEKFTDIKDRYLESDKGKEAILDTLREHVMRQARSYIPAGQRLEISFTDIDLAGEFEPWLGPRLDDVRIVKDIYPPRASLSYKLYAPDGTVLKQGSRDLSDLAFMMTISINVDDPLRYDKELLTNWIRGEFPKQKKT